VERLQVERGARTRARLLSDGEPGSLADLVADRLPRPAQVAIDLAPQEVLRLMAMLDGEGQHQLRRPRLRRVVALVRGDLQSNMHTDVDHDAHGAEGLCPEHPELVGWILQVPELTHQTLGVEGPALRVARYERGDALEPVELGPHLGQLAQP